MAFDKVFSGSKGKNRVRRVHSLMVSIFLSTGLVAAEDVAAQPPRGCFSNPSTLTDLGVVDLEVGLQSSRLPQSGHLHEAPIILYYGLLPFLDLRLAWDGPGYKELHGHSRGKGLGDPWVGGQALFLQQDRAWVDIALGFFHKFPTANRYLGSGSPDEQAFLVLTRAEGRWQWDLNLGQVWIGDGEGGHARQPFVSVMGTRSLGSGFHVSLEGRWMEENRLSSRVETALVSLQWKSPNGTCFDVGFEKGMNSRTPDRVFCGVACRLGQIR